MAAPQEGQDRLTAYDLGTAIWLLWRAGGDPLAVMLAELRPWVLGIGDPVRERVARR